MSEEKYSNTKGLYFTECTRLSYIIKFIKLNSILDRASRLFQNYYFENVNCVRNNVDKIQKKHLISNHENIFFEQRKSNYS